MKINAQRILAVLGLVLICASFVLMMVGLFAGDAKAPLLNISLFTFLGAVAVLLGLKAWRERKAAQDESGEEE